MAFSILTDQAGLETDLLSWREFLRQWGSVLSTGAENDLFVYPLGETSVVLCPRPGKPKAFDGPFVVVVGCRRLTRQRALKEFQRLMALVGARPWKVTAVRTSLERY